MLEIAPLLFEEFDVFASDDCNNILHLIENFKPDVIMLDVVLGVHDGTKICQAIKQHPVFKNIPVILMTAGFLRERDKLAGADGFVEKPFNTDKCISLLNQLTNRKI